MKKIEYQVPGAMLERSPDGKLARKPFNATAEIPFSEENLQKAETIGLPGSVQILRKEDHPLLRGEQIQKVLPFISLTDRATGKIVELYVENGQLMMEVL